MTQAKFPTSWFYILYIHSQIEIDSNSPSRLEIPFLLSCGATIQVLNLPIFATIFQIQIVCNNNHHDKSKTLTLANQSHIPIKQTISVTCFSSIETKSRSFMTLVAVIDLKDFNL